MPEAVTTTRIVSAGGQMQRTLTEASSMKMLAENLERLLLPDQLAVVLTNRKLQHVLSLVHKRSDLLRIEHWLRMRLGQSFMSVARTQGQLDAQGALLDSLVSVTAFFQEMPQVRPDPVCLLWPRPAPNTCFMGGGGGVACGIPTALGRRDPFSSNPGAAGLAAAHAFRRAEAQHPPAAPVPPRVLLRGHCGLSPPRLRPAP